jgi:hypothetical protein
MRKRINLYTYIQVDFQCFRISHFRHYATSQKDAGSRPDEVIEFFQFT